MGILGRMITKAVLEKIEDAATDSVAEHLQKTHSVDAIVNKSVADYRLFIKRKPMSIKRSFTVYDESNNKKYIIKTDSLTFGYPCIRLYDVTENEIGRVQLTSKKSVWTYSVYLDGKKFGRLCRKMSLKINFDLDVNGWHLDGNLIQNSFSVTDKGGYTVLKISDAFNSTGIYVLELNNHEHEILGLLLVMAVELALHGKD